MTLRVHRSIRGLIVGSLVADTCVVTNEQYDRVAQKYNLYETSLTEMTVSDTRTHITPRHNGGANHNELSIVHRSTLKAS
jgi:hypothetical protein